MPPASEDVQATRRDTLVFLHIELHTFDLHSKVRIHEEAVGCQGAFRISWASPYGVSPLSGGD